MKTSDILIYFTLIKKKQIDQIQSFISQNPHNFVTRRNLKTFSGGIKPSIRVKDVMRKTYSSPPSAMRQTAISYSDSIRVWRLCTGLRLHGAIINSAVHWNAFKNEV